MNLVQFYLNVICLYSLIKCNTLLNLNFDKLFDFNLVNTAISVSLSQSSYSIQYGSSVFIQATLSGFAEPGVVWRYYPTSSPSPATVIYFESAFTSFVDQSKFSISFSSSGTNVISTLEIKNAIFSDALNTYEVSCNFYKVSGCLNTDLATATIVILTTTTSTTISTSNSASSTNSSIILIICLNDL